MLICNLIVMLIGQTFVIIRCILNLYVKLRGAFISLQNVFRVLVNISFSWLVDAYHKKRIRLLIGSFTCCTG